MNLNYKTPRGAQVSVHFGKITTTNLWKGQWKIVQDAAIIYELRTVNPSDTSAIRVLHDKYYPTIDSKSVPYTRGMTAPSISTTSTPAPSPSLIIDPTKVVDSVDIPSTTCTGPATPSNPKPIQTEPTIELTSKRVEYAKKLQDFFSEFTFIPASRFVNTLSKLKSQQALNYVIGYMELSNNADTNDIKEKIKSHEFKELVKNLYELKSDKTINKRLTLYYGDPGTGKTTKAIAENPDAKVFMCNASITGDDLMQVFDFNDENGNPVFKKSIIREAMETGSTIILDEINLLSMDALRTLQEITDDKKCISFHGDDIEIADGFNIIGTMNLVVGGQTFGLPEPLVDRAQYIEEFKLTPEKLAEYSF